MSGFNNQIIGGMSKLVRDAIQSQDYVAAASGWSINKDGSAEFNQGTFRGTVVIASGGAAILVYSGPPAAGNLILAVSSVAGSDQYGNSYNVGVTVPGIQQGSVTQGQLTFPDPNFAADPAAIYEEYGAGAALQSQLLLQAPGGYQLGLVSNAAPDNQGGLYLGAGWMGKAYAEQVSLPGVNRLSGISGIVVPNAIEDAESDYGSAWNLTSGTWTCPVTSKFSIAFCYGYTTWTSGTPSRVSVVRNGSANGNVIAANEISNSPEGTVSVFTEKTLQYGDTLQFFAEQVSGSTRVSATDERAYISIRRCLT